MSDDAELAETIANLLIYGQGTPLTSKHQEDWEKYLGQASHGSLIVELATIEREQSWWLKCGVPMSHWVWVMNQVRARLAQTEDHHAF